MELRSRRPKEEPTLDPSLGGSTAGPAPFEADTMAARRRTTIPDDTRSGGSQQKELRLLEKAMTEWQGATARNHEGTRTRARLLVLRVVINTKISG